jgi:dTDP-4-dehydrorhamnose reductase
LVAHTCSELGIKFLFTSSVSVYSAEQCEPFSVDNIPKPDDDYGQYKFECEQRVLSGCPEALVVRLGWQIGTTTGGNHMVDYLDRTFKAQSRIEASIHWYQACSFLFDTAQCLTHMMQTLPSGLYHLDGNPGLNFCEIAISLNRLLGEPWIVIPCKTPVQNNRLIDDRVRVRLIAESF